MNNDRNKTMNRRNFLKATGIAAGSLVGVAALTIKAHVDVKTGKDGILRGMFPDTLTKASWPRNSIIAAFLVSNARGAIGYKVIYNDLSSEIRTTFTKDEIRQLFKNEENYVRRWEIQPNQLVIKERDYIVWSNRVL